MSFIKHLLLDRGQKQVELAMLLDIHPSTLNLYLQGWRKVPEALKAKLAKALGLKEQDLTKMLAREEEKNGKMDK